MEKAIGQGLVLLIDSIILIQILRKQLDWHQPLFFDYIAAVKTVSLPCIPPSLSVSPVCAPHLR
jgi:hypothetical protein